MVFVHRKGGGCSCSASMDLLDAPLARLDACVRTWTRHASYVCFLDSHQFEKSTVLATKCFLTIDMYPSSTLVYVSLSCNHVEGPTIIIIIIS